jgi:tRNA threonylcarbamoyladenosine biosynthesis protein TsaE
MLHLFAPSLAATHAIAGVMADMAAAGDVIVLAGDMGAGKTAFTQGFARALGVQEPVTSPTFTLVHTYETPGFPLHHADLYRLDRLSEVADLALGELVADEGVLLVEWGDVVAGFWGDHLEVTLSAVHDDDARQLTVRGSGSRWARRWDRLRQQLAPWTVDDPGEVR